MIFGPATVEQVLQHGALTTGTSDLAGPDSLSAGRPWGFRVAEFVFRNMPSRVRFLDLEGARLGSAELAEMAASLRQLDLVELSLAGLDIRRGDLLMSCIPPTLVSLNASHTLLSGEVDFVKGLGKSSRLARVDLFSNPSLGRVRLSPGVVDLRASNILASVSLKSGKAEPSWGQLRSLEAGNQPLRNDGLQALLGACKRLQVLSLQRAWLGHGCGAMFAEALSDRTSALTALNLAGNSLSDDDAEAIADALLRSPVRHINLGGKGLGGRTHLS